MSATSAHAYATWYGRKLIHGIGGGTQHYWVVPSATGYTRYADPAMSAWINTSSRVGVRTPLDWTKTTVKANARMEIHSANDPLLGAYAWVDHYVRQAVVKPWTSGGRNWVWGRMSINQPYFDSSFLCPNSQGIVSHEMGHVFGLAHVTTPGALMYDGVAVTSIKWATADDANGINALYK